ncbi:hypothetical protein FRB93_001986 [Tulasnella sp. JGI-2019a]|nr:hypothetical protein FRB93_001986 [Tulasnella sp. JGI-2019a]
MQNLMASTLQQQSLGTPYQRQQYGLQSPGTPLPRYMGGFGPQNPNLIRGTTVPKTNTIIKIIGFTETPEG